MVTKECAICGKMFMTEDNNQQELCNECTRRTAANMNRINHMEELMNGAYDKGIPEAGVRKVNITEIADDSETPEACWQHMVESLSVEYIPDNDGGSYIPVYYHLPFKSVYENSYYRKAIELLHDEPTREAYRKEGTRLESMRQEMIKAIREDSICDAFISDHPTGTEDIGKEIGNFLQENGMKVFRSGEYAPGKQPGDYEQHIFAALTRARLMVIVASSASDFEMWHVKSEWKRYLAYMNEDKTLRLLICLKNVAREDVPEALSKSTIIDVSERDYKSAISAFISGAVIPSANPAYISVSHTDGIEGLKPCTNATNDTQGFSAETLHLKNDHAQIKGQMASERKDVRLELMPSTEEDKLYNDKEEAFYAQNDLNSYPEKGHRGILAAFFATLIVAAAVAFIYFVKPDDRYSRAVAAKNNGNYDSAIEDLSAIDTVEARKALQETKYLKACELMNNGQYSEAQQFFREIPGYADADSRLDICTKEEKYQNAVQMMDNGAFSEAEKLFQEIRGYADTDSRLAVCISEESYQNAVQLMQGNKYQEAAAAFGALGNYSDSENKAKEAYYQYADTLYESGDLTGAKEAYASLAGYSDADNRVSQIEGFILAQSDYESANYVSAKARLDTLAKNDMTDALYQQCLAAEFTEAEALINEGKIGEAYDYLLTICDYAPAAAKAEEIDSSYALAQTLISDGKYDEAEVICLSLYDFRDTPKLLDSLRFARAEAYLQSGRLEEAQKDLDILKENHDVTELQLKLDTLGADRAFSNGEYAKALEHYLALTQTDELKEKEYTLAQKCKEDGITDIAESAFIALAGYKDSDSLLNDIRIGKVKDAFASGEYDLCIALLSECTESEETKKIEKECRYQKACEAELQGDYQTAHDMFVSLEGYSDSADKAKQCLFKAAVNDYENGLYEEAVHVFESLSDMETADAYARKCYYQLGMSYAAQEDIDNALNCLEKAGDTPETRTAFASLGTIALSQGDINKAFNLYLRSGIDTSKEQLASLAEELEAQDDTAGAVLVCYCLADDVKYNDKLIDLSVEVDLDEVSDRIYDINDKNGIFTSAIKDIETYRTEGYNRRINQYIASGKYDEAITLLEEYGDRYNDTEERLTVCALGQARVMYDNGDYEGAYEIYIAHQDQTEAQEMLSSDEHIAAIVQENSTNGRFRKIGNIVSFGSWEQNGDLSDGAEPIEWIVLKVDADRSMLVTAKAIDSIVFADINNSTANWENSNIRAWLNQEFLFGAFTAEEAVSIETTVNMDESSNRQCEDKVFLLSIDEAKNLLDDGIIKGVSTPWARSNGAFVAAGGSWQWLRSQGTDEKHIATISTSGHIDRIGQKANSKGGVVRPVVWLNVDLIPE